MTDRDAPLTPTGFNGGDQDGNSPLSASPFEPLNDTETSSARLLTPARAGLAAAVVAVLAVLFFLLTARSLAIVVATETQAEISIHGFALPIGKRWLIRPGDYRITVTAPGYAVWESTFTVSRENTQQLDVAPAILPGRVTITSNPGGAEVRSGDDILGITPLQDLELAAGSLPLKLQLPRYQTLETTVDITGREVAQTLSFDLNPDWADIALDTRPATVSLMVDEVPVAFVPGATIEVLSGERVLAIGAPGFETTELTIDVAAGVPQSIGPVVLTPSDGVVALTSKPSGANVSVNGEFRGQTPVELALRPGRRHDISITRPGYHRGAITLEIDQGSRTEREVELRPRLGEVVFAIQPENAELVIDGKPVGTGNQTLQLTAIAHRVAVQLDGYAAYRTTVVPREGLAQRLEVALMTEAAARKAALKPEITTPLGQTLRLIDPLAEPVNSFTLGAARRDPGRRSNETLRAVTLDRAFYIAETETTNAQFRQFLASHDSGQLQGNSLNREHQPVVTISWQQAASFCNWLSATEGLPPFYREDAGIITGFNAKSTGYRLPTEAEWAYVSRVEGETLRRFAWGDAFPPADKVTNVADNTSAFVTGRILNGYADGHVVSAPVASYPPNHRGLFDLGGNVAEWVHDVYSIPAPSSDPLINPLGPPSGDNYTIRGASWQLSRLAELRLTYRDYGAAGRDDLGFRVARYAE